MGGAVDDFYAVDHRFDTGKCILRVGEISVLELYGAPSAEVLSPNPSPRFARPDETVLLCCDAVPWRLKKAQDSLLQSYPLVSKRITLWTADDSRVNGRGWGITRASGSRKQIESSQCTTAFLSCCTKKSYLRMVASTWQDTNETLVDCARVACLGGCIVCTLPLPRSNH